MGEIIDFSSNGSNGQGYLATPDSGSGPGVIVIQEWWGLVDHIKDVCDRFASQGFVALAPDLYRGVVSAEPDEAGKLMMAMALDRAAKDMSGAVDEVVKRSTSKGVGVIGFCMGGGLALALASQRSDKVLAVAPFYGAVPWPDFQPDYSKINAAVQGHYAELDDWMDPQKARALESTLKDLGKQAEIIIHPGTQHAFFNDTRPEVYDKDASEQAWTSVIEFFKNKLV